MSQAKKLLNPFLKPTTKVIGCNEQFAKPQLYTFVCRKTIRHFFIILLIILNSCINDEGQSFLLSFDNSILDKENIKHINLFNRPFKEMRVITKSCKVFVKENDKYIETNEITLKLGDTIKIFSKDKYENDYDYCLFKIDNEQKEYYVPYEFISNIPPKIIGDIPIGKEKVDKTHPLPYGYIPSDLTLMDRKYSAEGYKWRKMYLRKEALKAFKKLIDDGEKAGVIIRLISAYRSAEYQDGLYIRAINTLNPKQRSSAKPCHSEHQLGTTADVSSPEVNYQLTQRFDRTSAYRWLENHSHKYGIYISYTKENHIEKGYIYEPWHLRYWGKILPEQ